MYAAEDGVFANWVRCLPALAFVPLEDVEDAFEELVDHPEFPEEAHALVAYYEVSSALLLPHFLCFMILCSLDANGYVL